jgi:hypothetical protein
MRLDVDPMLFIIGIRHICAKPSLKRNLLQPLRYSKYAAISKRFP